MSLFLFLIQEGQVSGHLSCLIGDMEDCLTFEIISKM